VSEANGHEIELELGATDDAGDGDGDGRRQPDDNGRDSATGRFTVGNSGGPGRPSGALDFMSICRRRAREADLDLEALVWAAARGLFLKASKGDASAAKIILDRTCGLLEKGLELNVDARSVTIGPPVPQGGDFVDYVRKLGEVAEHQHRRLEGGLVAGSNAEPEGSQGLTSKNAPTLHKNRYQNIASPDGADPVNPCPDKGLGPLPLEASDVTISAGEPGGRRRKTDSPGAVEPRAEPRATQGTDPPETTVEGPQIAAQGDPSGKRPDDTAEAAGPQEANTKAAARAMRKAIRETALQAIDQAAGQAADQAADQADQAIDQAAGQATDQALPPRHLDKANRNQKNQKTSATDQALPPRHLNNANRNQKSQKTSATDQDLEDLLA